MIIQSKHSIPRIIDIDLLSSDKDSLGELLIHGSIEISFPSISNDGISKGKKFIACKAVE